MLCVNEYFLINCHNYKAIFEQKCDCKLIQFNTLKGKSSQSGEGIAYIQDVGQYKGQVFCTIDKYPSRGVHSTVMQLSYGLCNIQTGHRNAVPYSNIVQKRIWNAAAANIKAI